MPAQTTVANNLAVNFFRRSRRIGNKAQACESGAEF